MPKVTHDRKLHISHHHKKTDDFGKAEKTSFVSLNTTAPSVQLDISKFKNNFKQLQELPTTQLAYDNQADAAETDFHKQQISKKEKQKQKKENFLNKLQPFMKKKESNTINSNDNNNNNNNQKQSRQDQEDDAGSLSMNRNEFMESIPERHRNGIHSDNFITSNVKLTNTKKKKISKQELDQYKNVVSHPEFKSNPFATLKEHLSNSVAAQNQKIEQRKTLERESIRRDKQNAKQKEKQLRNPQQPKPEFDIQRQSVDFSDLVNKMDLI
ncbi:hypothetical protein DFA_08695 [Cavenderia fasciculata]|uniref:Uncharacterized protein n=1 Tax=Cavenderia fasciculata TaxID=261658 RepID=F4Q3U3_CACFS|nr:uncharacterized protein DFA_08695 [Cavenderia fasciculata]EGG17699.1 hypothetical protein DFA_08695 [Cavenderia fasciculata]|eukprot:XP_004356183.1 hypothetical protein DFA_08695 [Cavenderia fasciculata]